MGVLVRTEGPDMRELIAAATAAASVDDGRLWAPEELMEASTDAISEAEASGSISEKEDMATGEADVVDGEDEEEEEEGMGEEVIAEETAMEVWGILDSSMEMELRMGEDIDIKGGPFFDGIVLEGKECKLEWDRPRRECSHRRAI